MPWVYHQVAQWKAVHTHLECSPIPRIARSITAAVTRTENISASVGEQRQFASWDGQGIILNTLRKYKYNVMIIWDKSIPVCTIC